MFGIPVVAFWMYAAAALLLIAGVIRVSRELPQIHGVDRIMPFGRLFYAIPLAVFGTEHFTDTAEIAGFVPRWIPAHTFWVLLIGAGFICGGISLAILVEARLAAFLVGMTFLVFVLAMDIPGIFRHPDSRFAWALGVRQLVFSGGAFAFAISPRTPRSLALLPRFFIAIPSVFYGVEHFLHPDHAPGIPLQKITPEWIPGRIVVSFVVGAVLIVASVLMIANRKTRIAATVLGITILAAVLWVYLPMVVAAPKSVEALNYLFDTLFFCGTILMLANAPNV